MSEEQFNGKVEDTSSYEVHVLYYDRGSYVIPALHCTLYKDMPDNMKYVDDRKLDQYKVMEATLDYHTLKPVEEGGDDIIAYLVDKGFDRDALCNGLRHCDNDDYVTIVRGIHDVSEYAVQMDPSKFIEWAAGAAYGCGLQFEDINTEELFLPQWWLKETGVPASDIGWETHCGELLEARKISECKSITTMVSTADDFVNRIDIEFADGSTRSFCPYRVSYNRLSYKDNKACMDECASR